MEGVPTRFCATCEFCGYWLDTRKGGRLPMGRGLGTTWRQHVRAAVRQSMGAPALRRERSPRFFGSRAGVITSTVRSGS